MPAKGRYFLNEGEEDPDQAALYGKYRLTSQHGPLLLTLLLVAVTACVALIIISFVCGVSGAAHRRWLGAGPGRPWASLTSLSLEAGLRGAPWRRWAGGGRFFIFI